MNKQEIIAKFRGSEKDTGSTGVQIALLTSRILHLAEHFKIHKKDNHSKRGLTQAVSDRKKLLTYLKRTKVTLYQEVIAALGLRK